MAAAFAREIAGSGGGGSIGVVKVKWLHDRKTHGDTAAAALRRVIQLPQRIMFQPPCLFRVMPSHVQPGARRCCSLLRGSWALCYCLQPSSTPGS